MVVTPGGEKIFACRPAGLPPDQVELIEEVGEETVRAEPANVQGGMLEAVRSVQVRSHDHLVIEAVDGVVQVNVVVTNLDTGQRFQGLEVAQGHVNPSGQGAI